MPNSQLPPLRVALLGCGVVGSQVARLIVENSEDLRARVGRRLDLVGIGVRNLDVERPGVDPALLTTDAESLVTDPSVDLVVELIGGIEPARSLILKAIEGGASVITANKALLAEDGATLFGAAESAGVDLYYEAAVAGAIPIIRPLRESLVGDDVTAVMGIVNGTTNYILDQMHTTGADFADAVLEAQELGFAEADPTADVEGYDAAAKAALLAGLAFHTRVRGDDVDREGMSHISATDVDAAKQMDCVIKLLATCTLSQDGSVAVAVHPTMVANTHPLASVGGAYNAVFVESRSAGRLMFMGPGAGGRPTASAVMGDLVTAARNRLRGVSGPGESTYASRSITPSGEVHTRFYLSMDVDDAPGVLARVAAVFASHGVSLKAVRQEAAHYDEVGWAARLGVMTHLAPAAAINATVAELQQSDDVRNDIRIIRVEGV